MPSTPSIPTPLTSNALSRIAEAHELPASIFAGQTQLAAPSIYRQMSGDKPIKGEHLHKYVAALDSLGFAKDALYLISQWHLDHGKDISALLPDTSPPNRLMEDIANVEDHLQWLHQALSDDSELIPLILGLLDQLGYPESRKPRE